MGRPRVDRTICRVCQKREPEVTLTKRKGEPDGICNPCRYHQRKLANLKKGTIKKPGNFGVLYLRNYKRLEKLLPGIYKIHFALNEKELDGFFAFTEESMMFSLSTPKYFLYNRHRACLLLANKGLLLSDNAKTLYTKKNSVVTLKRLFEGKVLSELDLSEL